MEDKEKETKRLNQEKQDKMKELERKRAALRTPEEQKRFEEMQKEQERLKAGILRDIEERKRKQAPAALQEQDQQDKKKDNRKSRRTQRGIDKGYSKTARIFWFC